MISQLVERYTAKKVCARNRWRLTSRFLRKALSYTTAVFLFQKAIDLPLLRFAEILTH